MQITNSGTLIFVYVFWPREPELFTCTAFGVNKVDVGGLADSLETQYKAHTNDMFSVV